MLAGLLLLSFFAGPSVVEAAVVLGLNNNFGSDPTLDVFTPNLSLISSVGLGMSGNAHRVIAVEGIQIDKNNNGKIEPDEVFDLAFVGGRKACSASGCGEIVIVDITRPSSPLVIGRIPMPGIIRELDVDREKKLLVAGGDRGSSSGSSSGAFYIVDISNPFNSFIDSNSDGKDDRILWTQPVMAGLTGGVDAVRFDTVRNLVYVGNNAFPYGRLDIWNLYTTPNPLLKVDKVPESDKVSIGAYIHVNNADSNKNGLTDNKDGHVGFEHLMRKITLFPRTPEGMIKLKAVNGSKIRVWNTATKGTEVTLPATFSTKELPKDLFVEGYEVSNSERDVQLIATYSAGGFTVEDKASITIVRVKARDRNGFPCYGLDASDYVPHDVVGINKSSTFTLDIWPIVTSVVTYGSYSQTMTTIGTVGSAPSGTALSVGVAVNGLSAGDTTADIKIAGSEVSKLDVSVYDEKPVTVAFFFVSDRYNHRSTWERSDIPNLITDINRIWEQQANVKFSSVGEQYITVGDLCLSILCRQYDWLLNTSLISGLILAKCSTDNYTCYSEDCYKITGAARQSGMPPADIRVYFVNDFASNYTRNNSTNPTELEGFEYYKEIFIIDKTFLAPDQSYIVAHELGHALHVNSHATPGFVERPEGELMMEKIGPAGPSCFIRKTQAKQLHP